MTTRSKPCILRAEMACRKPRRDIYQEVTDKILDFIDQGNLPPWRHPIRGRGTGDGWPKSLATGKRYRGVNVFLLAITNWMKGYSSDYWVTFKQARAQGAKVKKGEQASLVVFWKQYVKTDDETGEDITLPVLRHFNVFNAEQCADLAPPDAAEEVEPMAFDPIERAEAIVSGFANPPLIQHGGKAAAYYRREDKVRIAEPGWFTSGEAYYATLFHELAHATGHEKRLNREHEGASHVFGSPSYSKEELTAEFGAAFLAAAAGISPPTIEQSAAYIDGWRKKIASDKKIVVQAAGLGQRAADHVLGVTFETG